ncbi:WD repeat-containing protein 82-like isoform X1 [Aphelenchoides bicaudatus]|nr:WD repeat-containing protein 82-like isoform X1 [Aphelenchoides bicaudatus]
MNIQKSSTMPLTADSLKNMQAKTFKENSDVINGLSFSNSGEWMITSSNDDSITVYDILAGKKQRKVLFNSGAFDVKFLHTNNNVILAGQKDSSVRLFSLYDNKCIRFFKGHDKPVTNLEVSPEDDLFLSSASDHSVRLWDTRQSETIASLYLDSASPANVAFDKEGLIFAVTVGAEAIKLFDIRNYNDGPFGTFDLAFVQDSKWSSMTFSPDGKFILVVTDGNHLRLVESYEGTLTHTLTGHTNEDRLPLRAGFTPDSQYVFCGGSDRTITFWKRETGALSHKVQTDHANPIRITDFSTKYHLMCSTCKDTKVWLPSYDYSRRFTSASAPTTTINSGVFQYY